MPSTMTGIRTPELFAYQSPSGQGKVLRGIAGCGAAAIRKRFLQGKKLFNWRGSPVTRWDLPEGQKVILRHRFGTIKIVVEGDPTYVGCR